MEKCGKYLYSKDHTIKLDFWQNEKSTWQIFDFKPLIFMHLIFQNGDMSYNECIHKLGIVFFPLHPKWDLRIEEI